MNFSIFINHWILFASGNPIILILVIIIGTFVLEDATTIVVALTAASGQIGFGVALIALYIGIILGDLGLYTVGHLTSYHHNAKKLAYHRRLEPLREWLHNNLYIAIFSVRFVPGLRLPTYTAAGFFHLSFKRYTATVIVATIVWTTILFNLTYYFGIVTKGTLGMWRWPIGISIALLLFIFGRINIQKRFKIEERKQILPKCSTNITHTKDEK